MGGLMHLNDAAQLGGGRRRHLRKDLSAIGFTRLRFAGLRARAQALRLSTPVAIVMLVTTIVLMAVTTTPPAAAARQAHPARPGNPRTRTPPARQASRLWQSCRSRPSR